MSAKAALRERIASLDKRIQLVQGLIESRRSAGQERADLEHTLVLLVEMRKDYEQEREGGGRQAAA